VERLSVHINSNQDVFITWIDKSSSGTLTLTPAEAISIGEVGGMAKLRKAVQKNDKRSNNRI
jgi:hypothetical protein